MSKENPNKDLQLVLKYNQLHRHYITNSDDRELFNNVKFVKYYNEYNDTIDIMRYTLFYCMKECVALDDGMNKFNTNLAEVFKNTNNALIGIHQSISIGALYHKFIYILLF